MTKSVSISEDKPVVLEVERQGGNELVVTTVDMKNKNVNTKGELEEGKLHDEELTPDESGLYD